MYFCNIIILYGSVLPLAEHSCNRASRSASSPVLTMPHICSKVRVLPLDICFYSSCLSCVLFLEVVVAEVLFARVVFATKMEMISATKYVPCGFTPPVATGPPGVVRVGKHCAIFSLAHHRAGMVGAAKSAVPIK